MSISRTRSIGSFVPLSAYYYQDDKIGDAGPLAELLFVRGLAYCAGNLTDGFMTERQVRLFVAVGLDDAEDLSKRLVAVGLWDRDDARGGYMVRNFLKFNRSREEIDLHRARDAARKRASSKSGDSADGVRAESSRTSSRNPSGIHRTEHNRTEQNIKSDRTPSGPVRSDFRATDRPLATAPPDLSQVREKLRKVSSTKTPRSARSSGEASQ